MNKYLHYFAPILLSTLAGFAVGYGFQYNKIVNLKNQNLKLAKHISEINADNSDF